jgi:glycosyltransferase involved in cell wall biosynthesis
MINTNRSLISVAMTVFNAAPFLAKSIESLLAQDHGNFELIISDNASEDGSSEICRRYASLDKRIHITEMPSIWVRPGAALKLLIFVQVNSS